MGVSLKYVWHFFVGRGFSDFLDDNKINEVNSIEIRELREQLPVSKVIGLSSENINKILSDVKTQIVYDYLFRDNADDYKIIIVGDGKEFSILEEV